MDLAMARDASSSNDAGDGIILNEEGEMTSTASIKKGDNVLVTSEEYSDYGVVAFCQAKRDFNPAEEVVHYQAFLKSKGIEEDALDAMWEDTKFADWLIETGYLEKLQYKELWVGAWGRTEPSVR